MSENKNTPKLNELINQSAREEKAFLKRLAYGDYSAVVKDGISFNPTNNDPKNTLPQNTESFDLWVTEVMYGYGLTGSNAPSRFYNKFYSQYFRKDPIQVKGICKDESEYNELAKFIRETQVNATIDHNNLFLLQIPGAGIRSIGMVSGFQSGISSNNQGIPIAPEFNFEFIVFRDLTDAYDAQYSSNVKFSYFTNTYGVITDDRKKTPALFSTDQGSIKPFNPPKNPTAPKKDPTEGINGGTNGAKGS
jgi:hypothetical protein